MSAPPSPEPQSSPATLPVLLLVVILSLIGFGVVLPLLPFFAQVFDAEPWQVTLLFSVYSAGQFAGELTWGRLSDRIGRRPVLIATIVASALGYVALAFAPGIWIAVLVRAAQGFFSGNISVIQGYIVDVSPSDRLAGRLGLVGSAFGIGFVIGPALGGILAEPQLGAAGFRPPLFVAAGLCLLATLGLIAFVRESRRLGAKRPARRKPLAGVSEIAGDPVLTRAFATLFLGFFASSSLWSILGLWADAVFGWSAREVGLVMAATGVSSAITQGLIAGWLVRRVGAGPTIAYGLVGGGVCVALMAITPWGWLVTVLLTVSVIGTAVWQPACMSIVSLSSDPERQGAMLGAASASGSAARVVGPVISGALFSGIAPWAPVVASALFMLPAAWLGWRAAEALKRSRARL